ncbi:hypothetical protein D9M72_517280 [compost metagenome]
MPAACMATSVPPPMAMPMSAAASAGASLMPSPTIATTPVCFSAATVAALSAGSTSAYTSWMPKAWATTLALPRLSPVSRWLLMFRALSCCTACSAPGLRVSPKANRPSTWGSGDCSISQDKVRPSFSHAIAESANGPAPKPLSSSRRRLPSARRRPSRLPAMPRPVRDWLSLTSATFSPRSAQASRTALANGCSLPRCRAPANCSRLASLPSMALR